MLDIGFLNYLREMNITALLVRYALAVICGGVIGIEREQKQRPAGFRTHILVCIGAVTTMLLAVYLREIGYSTDVARMGAQVISGIGFLGAGTILVTRHQHIKGLTTAAGLWASACIGLAVGAGFYEAAAVGTIAIVIVSSLRHRVDRTVAGMSKTLRLYIEAQDPSVAGALIKTVRENGSEITDIDIERVKEKNLTVMICEIESKEKNSNARLLELVRSAEGVFVVEEL